MAQRLWHNASMVIRAIWDHLGEITLTPCRSITSVCACLVPKPRTLIWIYLPFPATAVLNLLGKLSTGFWSIHCFSTKSAVVRLGPVYRRHSNGSQSCEDKGCRQKPVQLFHTKPLLYEPEGHHHAETGQGLPS